MLYIDQSTNYEHLLILMLFLDVLRLEFLIYSGGFRQQFLHNKYHLRPLLKIYEILNNC